MTVLERFYQRDRAALSRIISFVENREDRYLTLLSRLYPECGNGYKIGITGPPGAGKSTLVDKLAIAYISQGKSVGVIAVDPTSPFTGGALLGDRIRMQDLSDKGDVFIRSMATRGSSGGLAAATREVSMVLDAFGYDIILIETVGVGQIELDIAGICDTTTVVLVPESGDGVQTLKAGLMEIADIFAVNKADRQGSSRLISEIRMMLDTRSKQNDWTFPVVKTEAINNVGIDDLSENIALHRDFIERTSPYEDHERNRIKSEFKLITRQRLNNSILMKLLDDRTVDYYTENILRGDTDPYTAAQELLSLVTVREGGKISSI